MWGLYNLYATALFCNNFRLLHKYVIEIQNEKNGPLYMYIWNTVVYAVLKNPKKKLLLSKQEYSNCKTWYAVNNLPQPVAELAVSVKTLPLG